MGGLDNQRMSLKSQPRTLQNVYHLDHFYYALLQKKKCLFQHYVKAITEK